MEVFKSNVSLEATPTSDTHVVNKKYVDDKSNGFTDKYGFDYNYVQSKDFKNVITIPNEHGIYEIQVTDDNTEISIYSSNSNSSMLIDYGDGTVESLSISSVKHTYNAGTYILRLKNCYIYKTDKATILDVRAGAIKNCDRLYDGFKGTSLDLTYLDTTYATSMLSMFGSCTNLTTLDLSNFDTSNVTNTAYMFNKCSSLKTLDLRNFNTSKVTSMNSMFSYCENLTTLDVSSFDTSNVFKMNSMFSHCTNLTTLDLSNFNTYKVNDMKYMFEYCTNLTTLDLSNFDTSNVTGTNNMFGSCTNLTTLDLSNFDTSNVTVMFRMFYKCQNLTTIKLGSKFITANVTSYNEMFAYDTKLTTIQIPSDFPSESRTFLESRLTDAGILSNVTFEVY